jgi:hypothetical protein
MVSRELGRNMPVRALTAIALNAAIAFSDRH